MILIFKNRLYKM